MNNDNCEQSPAEFKTEIRNSVDNIRQVPNKDNEFKVMMLEDELQKAQNNNLEIDDWSMYDGQYPRLGPKIFNNCENGLKFTYI